MQLFCIGTLFLLLFLFLLDVHGCELKCPDGCAAVSLRCTSRRADNVKAQRVETCQSGSGTNVPLADALVARRHADKSADEVDSGRLAFRRRRQLHLTVVKELVDGVRVGMQDDHWSAGCHVDEQRWQVCQLGVNHYTVSEAIGA